MKKVMYGFLATAILSMVGCSAMEGVGGDSRTPGLAVASEKERQISPDVSNADLDALVEGNATFAFELYRLLTEREGNENLFYSPYSISLALAMTYVGARGETQVEMADVLHFTLSQERLHPAFNALDQELAQRGEGAEGKGEADSRGAKGFRLNIANAIWGQEDYRFLDTFLDILAQNYGAGLRTLDFAGSPEESRVAINDWVNEQTEGKIEDLIPQGGIDALTRLVLTNAIYFNAAWANPFEEAATREEAFTLLDGREVSVPMMRQSESLGYAAGEGYQAVELPYDGREMSMVIVVPEEGEFEAFEDSLDAGQVEAVIEQLRRRQVALKMPRFEFDARFSLKEALTALGMPQAFSDAGDFSGMTGKKDLLISDVFHKAFVSVDEAGTEAAAATAVVMKLTSAAPDSVEVNVDRPFLFLIRDIETGAILFVGRVVDPST